VLLGAECHGFVTVPRACVSDASCVTSFAPRLSPRLLAAISRLDDGRLPIAEVCRRVCAEADRLGLPRPSYQRVRVIVHEERRLRAAQIKTGEILLDVAFRVRPPEAVVDHLSAS
jgi:hypothetical protein